MFGHLPGLARDRFSQQRVRAVASQVKSHLPHTCPSCEPQCFGKLEPEVGMEKKVRQGQLVSLSLQGVRAQLKPLPMKRGGDGVETKSKAEI